MGNVKKETFQKNLAHLISGVGKQELAILLAEDVLTGSKASKDLTSKDVDQVEAVAAALLRCCRQAGMAANNFQLRETTQREEKLLAATKEKLNLTCRWKDHVIAADFEKGTCLIAEPYGLEPDDFADFVKLGAAGWVVEVDQRLASHFPTRTVAVKLYPPKPVSPLLERLQAKAHASELRLAHDSQKKPTLVIRNHTRKIARLPGSGTVPESENL